MSDKLLDKIKHGKKSYRLKTLNAAGLRLVTRAVSIVAGPQREYKQGDHDGHPQSKKKKVTGCLIAVVASMVDLHFLSV